MSILFICTGNICRSPSADAILKHKLKEKNISHINVDSAGIGDWHVESPPDKRAIKVAKEYGFDISHIRARQLQLADFYEFDTIVAMDDSHYQYLIQKKPIQSAAKILYFCDYFMTDSGCSVADPYYGEIGDFHIMIKQIIKGCDGIVKEIINHPYDE